MARLLAALCCTVCLTAAAQPVSVFVTPVADTLPDHSPAELNALITNAFQNAANAQQLRLEPDTAADVLVQPSLGPGAAGKVRISWLLRSRQRPNLTARTAFEFKSTNFGVAGISAMVGPVVAKATNVRAEAQRELEAPALANGEVDPSAQPYETTEQSLAASRAARWTAPRNAITLRPKLVFLLLPINGILRLGGVLPIQLSYERALHPKVSLFIAPEVFAPIPYFALGAELGVRYFGFGNAPDGFSVGASLSVDVIPANANLPTTALITPAANVGYSAIWGSGITANIFVHVGYMIGTAGGFVGIGGVALGLSAGVGYAF
jgi:hypothetical protein